MKIVFVSNFLNHHQLPVCLQFTEGNDFHFIATMPTPKAQVSLGYDDMNGVYDFVIKAYESHALKELAQRKIETADVVIAGSCAFPFEMIEKRLKEDKLTFWFSERLFKHSPLMRFYPPTVKRVLSQCTAYKANENFYLLAAGAYTAADYHYFQAFCGKSFKWGYFPANSDSLPEVIRQQKQKNTKLTLLWAGRFLPFKHPDYALYASHILTKAGIEHEVYMLGEGSLFDPIKQKVAKTGGKDFSSGGYSISAGEKLYECSRYFSIHIRQTGRMGRRPERKYGFGMCGSCKQTNRSSAIFDYTWSKRNNVWFQTTVCRRIAVTGPGPPKT